MREEYNGTNRTLLFRRIIAGAIDYLIILIFFIILLYFFGETSRTGGHKLNGLPALIMIVFWIIITAGIEYVFGSTLGNKICGLKPISLTNEGSKLRFIQSLKRHLLDVIDMSLFGLIGILLITNTENNQRLGDIWAKTKVVKTEFN